MYGNYKIQPVRRQIRKLLPKAKKVSLWLGISYDEMQRMKEANVKWVKHRFPLIENRIKRIDCINNFKAQELPVPVRSSCVICPYYSDNYWLWIYENEPDNFAAAISLEEKSDIIEECFIHRSCRPLKEVIIDILKGKELASKQLNMFPELIEECGVFVGFKKGRFLRTSVPYQRNRIKVLEVECEITVIPYFC